MSATCLLAVISAGVAAGTTRTVTLSHKSGNGICPKRAVCGDGSVAVFLGPVADSRTWRLTTRPFAPSTGCLPCRQKTEIEVFDEVGDEVVVVPVIAMIKTE